jgi:type III secretion system low calcium response chaperone LcrH/SycD
MEFQVYQTVQEMFGISKESYDAMYKIGSDFFTREKTEEALKIFVLLTTLNNLVFEPWLGLGSCWQMKNRFPEALQAFSMAALLKYDDPAPHLFTAEVYLQMDQKKLSEETFTLALSKMDDTQKLVFKDHIKYLKENLNIK